MAETVSIAIETSCRQGGLALGRGDEMVQHVDFDASRRHAAQLIVQMDELLTGNRLAPGDLGHVYVSAGPGGFTGLRVGITVARTLGQFVPHLRCVTVPTPLTVAENVRDHRWEHLGVVLDAGEGEVYATTFHRADGIPAADGPAVTSPADQFLARMPRPILLTGEGLWYHDLAGENVALASGDVRFPTAEGLWRVGRRLATAGQFTSIDALLPIYFRPPAAQRGP